MSPSLPNIYEKNHKMSSFWVEQVEEVEEEGNEGAVGDIIHSGIHSGEQVHPPQSSPVRPAYGRDYTLKFTNGQSWASRDEMLEHFRRIGVSLYMVLTIKTSWPTSMLRRGAVQFACENFGVQTEVESECGGSCTNISMKAEVNKLFSSL